jgi:hypothetical protein
MIYSYKIYQQLNVIMVESIKLFYKIEKRKDILQI